jgi:hypothetical protein
MEVRTMSKETISLGKLLEVYGVEEEQGYEAPFLTLTWARWQELQGRMLENFSRFQRAVDKQQPQLATIIALEMQEIVSELQREACAWVGETASHGKHAAANVH